MNLRYENKKHKQGYTYIIGCDEVGRGSLAGPVVAAAVLIDPRCKLKDLSGIRDSKKLSPEQREKLQPLIKRQCLAWGIGIVEEKIIDKINIHNATLLAIKQAVEMLLSKLSGVIPSESDEPRNPLSLYKGSLHSPSDALRLGRDDTKMVLITIDGKFTIPGLDLEQEAIVDGDNKILSIAAASIIAKVYRDDLMRKLHRRYPIYNFARHKGYGTLFHRTMILQNGLSPIHRKSFCKNLAI